MKGISFKFVCVNIKFNWGLHTLQPMASTNCAMHQKPCAKRGSCWGKKISAVCPILQHLTISCWLHRNHLLIAWCSNGHVSKTWVAISFWCKKQDPFGTCKNCLFWSPRKQNTQGRSRHRKYRCGPAWTPVRSMPAHTNMFQLNSGQWGIPRCISHQSNKFRFCLEWIGLPICLLIGKFTQLPKLWGVNQNLLT